MIKNKKNLKTISFTDDLYRASFNVCIGDLDTFIDHMKTNYGIILSDNIHSSDGFQFSIEHQLKSLKTRVYFIYMRNKSDFFTLAHELIHLVAEIFIDRKVNIDLEKDQEAFAYYHTYLFETIWKSLNSKKKSLTKKK